MANCGVTFGGVDLGSVSPYFHIIDEQIGGVVRKASSLEPSLADGQYFANLRHDTRPISVVFSILDVTDVQRAQSIRKLAALLAGKEPRKYRSPRTLGGYINAVCTSLPSPSALDWAGDLTIEFTAFDPFIYSDFDDLNAVMETGNDYVLYINCSGSVLPTIKQIISSPLTDPTWACNNGQFIMLQGSVAAGVLTIDSEHHTIKHTDDDAIMEKLSLDSIFFEFSPTPGVSTVPIVISCSNGAAGTITGKYRWL